MSGPPGSVALPHPVSAEDRIRADLYALVARLFTAAPDAPLLDLLARAPELPDEGSAPLAEAYNALLRASRAMDADAAEQEYTDLFVGVGKSEVNLHGSHWHSDAHAQKPLVTLRSDLAAVGLARKGESAMFEDHFAALCESMRLLIAGDVERRSAPIDAQRKFFQKHLQPWVFDCCAAIEHSSLANYYIRVAEFTCLFMAVERDSLDMD